MFRDELVNLLPHDIDARRLAAQSHSLAELLVDAGYTPPELRRSALLQTHCHQHAVIGTDADTKILAGMGLELRRPDSGCCGMAGSFGYETGERYRVSMAARERVLLPEVRAAEDATFLLADGFSCRAQIAHAGTRRALHLAQVLALAHRYGPGGPPDRFPEQADPAPVARPSSGRTVGSLAAGASAAVAGGVLVRRARTARRRMW